MLCLFSMIVPFQMVMFTLSKLANMMHLSNPVGIILVYQMCIRDRFYAARRILKEKLDGKPIALKAWKQEYAQLKTEYAELSPPHKPLRAEAVSYTHLAP